MVGAALGIVGSLYTYATRFPRTIGVTDGDPGVVRGYVKMSRHDRMTNDGRRNYVRSSRYHDYDHSCARRSGVLAYESFFQYELCDGGQVLNEGPLQQGLHITASMRYRSLVYYVSSNYNKHGCFYTGAVTLARFQCNDLVSADRNTGKTKSRVGFILSSGLQEFFIVYGTG